MAYVLESNKDPLYQISKFNTYNMFELLYDLPNSKTDVNEAKIVSDDKIIGKVTLIYSSELPASSINITRNKESNLEIITKFIGRSITCMYQLKFYSLSSCPVKDILNKELALSKSLVWKLRTLYGIPRIFKQIVDNYYLFNLCWAYLDIKDLLSLCQVHREIKYSILIVQNKRNNLNQPKPNMYVLPRLAKKMDHKWQNSKGRYRPINSKEQIVGCRIRILKLAKYSYINPLKFKRRNRPHWVNKYDKDLYRVLNNAYRVRGYNRKILPVIVDKTIRDYKRINKIRHHT